MLFVATGDSNELAGIRDNENEVDNKGRKPEHSKDKRTQASSSRNSFSVRKSN